MKASTIFSVVTATAFAMGGLFSALPAQAAKPRATKSAKRANAKPKAVMMTVKVDNLNASTKPKQLKAMTAAVKKVKGVKKVTANKKRGQIVVRHLPEADVQAINTAITSSGFPLAAAAPAPESEDSDY